jgi:hypothetical protein
MAASAGQPEVAVSVGAPGGAGLPRKESGLRLAVGSVVKDRGGGKRCGEGVEARTQFARRLIIGFR